ncbi:MAG: multiheme c-type cytochrome [Pseudomonadota bacterium]
MWYRCAILSATAWLLTACQQDAQPQPESAAQRPASQLVASIAAAPSAADFVGSQACADCHQAAYDEWRTSHHALAMQPADPETIEADFAARMPGYDLRREKDTFTIRDLNHDGDPMRIRYAFGVAPLQQYLADTGDGKLQATRLSWDTRPQNQGGQRWFHLYGGEHIDRDDILHWMGPAQNWNSMCADCHSTYVARNFNLEQGTYETTFTELSVGCEACHGPGAAHTKNPELPLPANATLRSAATQPDVCAQCHSRRSQIAEGYVAGAALLDHYLPEFLNPPLYHADGQIRDEVYVYGSFVTSKMHQAGVTCSDCHKPHSATLKLPGDQTCTQCHSKAGNPRFATLARKDYTSPAHQQHPIGTLPCTACHMPTTTYMEVDARHDHGFKRPAPGLSASVGAPDPCRSCHDAQTDTWVAAQLQGRAPSPSPFVAALATPLDTEAHIRDVTRTAARKDLPALARATLLARLVDQPTARQVLAAAAQDTQALVRFSVIEALPQFSPTQQLQFSRAWLSDPTLAVRTQAARAAALYLTEAQQRRLQPQLETALVEYRSSQSVNAERPEAHVNLATLAAQRGEMTSARTSLQRALDLQPRFVPAWLHLAELERQLGDDAQAGVYLRQAAAITPQSAQALYAFALWQVRQRAYDRAVTLLGEALRLAPADENLRYSYAVALNSTGRSPEALALIDTSNSAQALLLNTTINRDVGDLAAARAALARLREHHPSHPALAPLLRQLQGQG